MRVRERSLSEENLLLAVIDDESARVLTTSSIPLRHLSPGQHYNLKLSLPAGAELFLTVFLEQAPTLQLTRWRALSDVDGVLQVRLAECSAALGEGRDSARHFGVLARFSVHPESTVAAAEAAAVAVDSAVAADAETSPAATESEGERETGSSGGSSQASADVAPQVRDARARSSAVLAPAPVLATRSEAPLQLSTVYTALSGDHTALHILAALAERQRDARVAVVPILGAADVATQLWPVMHGAITHVPHDCQGGTLRVALFDVAMASDTASKLGQCEVPLAQVAREPAGDLAALKGLELKGAAGVSWITARLDLNGGCRGAPSAAAFPSGHAVSLVGGVPPLSWPARVAAGGATVTLEVRHWSTAEFIRTLEATAPSLAVADAALWSASHPALQPPASAIDALLNSPAAVLDILVGDMMEKQGALERLQAAGDLAHARSSLAMWRLKDMSSRNETLEQSITELRKLLHARTADEAAVDEAASEDVANMSRSALQEQCVLARQRVRTERCKNVALVRRLQVHPLPPTTERTCRHSGLCPPAHPTFTRRTRRETH